MLGVPPLTNAEQPLPLHNSSTCSLGVDLSACSSLEQPGATSRLRETKEILREGALDFVNIHALVLKVDESVSEDTPRVTAT
jgi:hypothetical protein